MTESPGCQFAGELPQIPVECQHCHKLRSRFDVLRCRRNGGPRIEGAGDVLAAGFRVVGIDRLAKAVLGPDCGCAQRAAMLNAMFPIESDPNDVEPSQTAPSSPETSAPVP